MNDKDTPMPRRKLLTIVVLVAVALCAGLVLTGPGWWVGRLLDADPADLPYIDRERGMDGVLDRRFEAGGEVRITAEELTQVVDPVGNLDLDAFQVELDGDRATVDAVVYVYWASHRYLNVHATFRAEADDGRIASLLVDELVVSGWDLGRRLRGRELADDISERLPRVEEHWPEVGAVLDEVDHAAVEDGVLVIQLREGGYERVQEVIW